MITTNQARQYIQSKEEQMLGILTPPTLYYLRVFEIFRQKKFFLSWNWAAFSAAFLNVGHLWFTYRKMYVFAGIYWLISNGLSLGLVFLAVHILPHFTNIQNKLLPLKLGYAIATLLLSNAMGVFANTIYFSSMRHSINKGMPGGTNPAAALIVFLSTILLFSIVKKFGIPNL
jgi:hypothetical protein